jgi:hypothetical protein
MPQTRSTSHQKWLFTSSVQPKFTTSSGLLESVENYSTNFSSILSKKIHFCAVFDGERRGDGHDCFHRTSHVASAIRPNLVCPK